ncbi:Crp/Fnr family transcriptional regulator [Paenibacillus cymbidii]|uniref:Crp/Fnr family transcriptional regulator n=1 Tax=Paenibacillus cymbidii TaxID=1639034 RepID=UPI00108198C4|nr:Crp/Fnr family transcriptional regulator [Paenibacillus cymbidii]
MIQNLTAVNLFKAIPEDDCVKVMPLFKSRSFKKNHTLIFENERSNDDIYIIRSGIAKVYRIQQDQELIFNFHLPGDVVGEVEAICGGATNYRLASVEAVEPIVAWVIAGSDFRHIMDAYPIVWKNAYLVLAERLKVMNRKIRSLAFDDLRTQTANLLLDLYDNCGVNQGNERLINLKVTQGLLADLLGVTRESVSKIMNEFKRDRVIEMRQKFIYILDMAQLDHLCVNSDPESRRWHS